MRARLPLLYNKRDGLIVSLLCLCLLIWYKSPFASVYAYRWKQRLPKDSTSASLVCDPYAAPGFVHFDPSIEQYTPWISLDPTCPTGSNWLEKIRIAIEDLGSRPPASPASNAAPLELKNEDIELRDKFILRDQANDDLWWLRDKTILLIGDSVDRNGMEQLAGLAGHSSYKATSYFDAKHEGAAEGWDERGVPHIVRIDRLNTVFVNAFFYGVDDNDTFKGQHDWHAPGAAEDRIVQLFKPFTEQLAGRIDFIQLHSGMWDMALFARNDIAATRSLDAPLTTEQLTWWLKRMRSIVLQVQTSWPNCPVWLRTLHRIGELSQVSTVDYVFGMDRVPEKPNFFPDNRIHQLRNAQISIAKSLCLPLHDFSHHWEGFQHLQDKVHPLTVPGGTIYGDALLEAIHLEALGRHKWRDRPC